MWDCGKRQNVGLWQSIKCGTVTKGKMWDCGKRQSVGLAKGETVAKVKVKCGTVAKGKVWDCGKR